MKIKIISKFKKFIRKIFHCKIKVYIINDTRRLKGHLGCHLVVSNLEKIAQKHNMKIIFFDTDYPSNTIPEKKYKKLISKADAVIVNGEGSLHHNRALNFFKKCEMARKHNIPCFLINTIWQKMENMEKYLNLFEIISVRESRSFNALPQNIKNRARIVPDLSLYGEINDRANNLEDKIIFVDSVFPEKTKMIEKLAHDYNAPMYYMSAQKDSNNLTEDILKGLSKNSLIITGRFHAAVQAIKYQIPFYAFSSNSYKIEGLLEDIGLKQLLLDDIEWLKPFSSKGFAPIKQIFSLDAYSEICLKYTTRANKDLEKLFDDIYNKIIKD